jgi:hypothetical protein
MEVRRTRGWREESVERREESVERREESGKRLWERRMRRKKVGWRRRC